MYNCETEMNLCKMLFQIDRKSMLKRSDAQVESESMLDDRNRDKKFLFSQKVQLLCDNESYSLPPQHVSTGV